MSTKKISVLEVFIWIVLTLFLFLALSPYLVGFKVKTDYTNLIDRLSHVSQVDLNITAYDQGFFSSEAKLELKLPESEEIFSFTENIIHGPLYLGLINQGKSPLVAAVINGELNSTNSQIELLNNVLADSASVMYQHLIDFNGDVTSQVYVPSISKVYEDQQGPVTFKTSGAIFNQSLTRHDGNLKGDIKIPMLKIIESDYSLAAEDLVLSFSGKEGNNQLMIGDTVISIGSLNIKSLTDQFAVRDLTARSTTSEQDDLINSGTQISAREILASNHKFGPLKFNISLNGLNANSLLRIQQIQTSIDQQVAKGVSADEASAMLMQQVMVIVPDLIKQAEININPLSINSELGRLEADMDFRLEGLDSNSPADPEFLLNAVNLELNMSIDEPLMKQFVTWNIENLESNATALADTNTSNAAMASKVNDNIKAMLDISWIIKSEAVYMTKISMHKGVLLVNDKPLDPMQQIISSVSGETH